MRSDTFSAVAIGISVAAASTSMYQALIARRKEIAENEATEPVIEIFWNSEIKSWGHDWAQIRTEIALRDDFSNTVRQIKIVRPKNSQIEYFNSVANVRKDGENALPAQPPKFRSSCTPNYSVMPSRKSTEIFVVKLTNGNTDNLPVAAVFEVLLNDTRGRCSRRRVHAKI